VENSSLNRYSTDFIGNKKSFSQRPQRAQSVVSKAPVLKTGANRFEAARDENRFCFKPGALPLRSLRALREIKKFLAKGAKRCQ